MDDEQDPLERMLSAVAGASETEAALAKAVGQMMGGIQQMAMGLERYEYHLVPLSQLSAHGAERWRVVPIPTSVMLPGPDGPEPCFLMERQVVVDDEQLARLSQDAPGAP